MTRYFMQDTHLAGLEMAMMIPPGFTPRHSGMMVLNHYSYTKENTDCRFCTQWHRRKCTAGHCKWIAERLRADAVSFGELIGDCFRELTSPGLQKRLRAMTAGFQGSLYGSDEHMRRFRCVCGQLRLDTNKAPGRRLAALFLLTSSQELWRLAERSVTADGVCFEKIRLTGLSTGSYAVYQAAKSISSGKLSISPSELANRNLVEDAPFRLIVGGVLIARFGGAVLEAKWKDGAVC